ncbi:basic proline-rich protein-like [Erinaceus europaeus]|uniref:Basic proline-rich protein-like n=1 Tax=Erinaceus europaeus TaxID=9365 RepID=A0ABM3XD74_ERIEU|nr:basic proline-rich protein-like [Erinaceus europaeus]
MGGGGGAVGTLAAGERGLFHLGALLETFLDPAARRPRALSPGPEARARQPAGPRGRPRRAPQLRLGPPRAAPPSRHGPGPGARRPPPATLRAPGAQLIPSRRGGGWRGRGPPRFPVRGRDASLFVSDPDDPLQPPSPCQGSLLGADMAESSSPPPSTTTAPATERSITEQPGPQSPPPSPPGPAEPLDEVDPDVPHPDLAPVAFFCLRQTTSPRNWCIKMVCNPYPLLLACLCVCGICSPWWIPTCMPTSGGLENWGKEDM